MISAESHAVDEYISSLSDLKTNFKPLINVLTILAEENAEYAPAIVQAIENHLQQVKNDSKLPVFYLIDSIVKNVGGDYRSLFARNIVDTFCSVFEKVDEDTRVRLRKLRRTWNNVFPAKNLSSLDVRVDRANSRSSDFPCSDIVTASETVAQEQLIVNRELLDLEMQKIELELIQAKMSLEQQRRQLENFMALASLPANHTENSNDAQTEPVGSKAIASVRPITRDPSKAVSSFMNRSVENANSHLQRSDNGLEEVDNETVMRPVSSVCNIPTDNFCNQFATTLGTQSRTNIVVELPKNYSPLEIAETKNSRDYDNFDITVVVDSESLNRDEIKDVRHDSQQKDHPTMDNCTEIAENLPSDDGVVDSTSSSLSSPRRNESIDDSADSAGSSLSNPQRSESSNDIVDSAILSLSSSHRHEDIDVIVDSKNAPATNPQRLEMIDVIVDSENASVSNSYRHESIDIKSTTASNTGLSSNEERSSDFMKPFERKLGRKSSSKSSQGRSKIRKTNSYCKSSNWSECEEIESRTNSWIFRSRTSSKTTYQSSKSRINKLESRKSALRFQRRKETTINSIFGKDHRSPLENLAPERWQNSQHVGSTKRENSLQNGSFDGFKSKMCSKYSRQPGAMRPPDFNRIERSTKTPIVKSLDVEMEVDEEAKNEPVILPVTFDQPETLKVRHPTIVTALYSGNQCGTCGVRFDSKQVTAYRLHLDWHFRQNRQIKESGRKPSSRCFYYSLEDWMEFTLVEDLVNRPLSFFEIEKPSTEMRQKQTEDSLGGCTSVQPSILCRSGGDSWCRVCQDAFEEFYDDEVEEWCLRPTVSYEGKNYHPLCLEDYKRSSEKSPLDRSTKEEDNLHTQDGSMDGAKKITFQFDSEQIKQELSNISSVEKGHEISALCSIM